MKESDDLQWSANKDGFIFMGLEAATQEDMDELEAYAGGEPVIQQSSLCGRWAPQWTATGNQDMGGLGSHTYEVQKVDPGGQDVEFKPEDQGVCFHYHNGKRVKGKIDYPNTGRSYHNQPGLGLVTGPRPGSEAEELLGGRKYKFNEANQWFVIK